MLITPAHMGQKQKQQTRAEFLVGLLQALISFGLRRLALLRHMDQVGTCQQRMSWICYINNRLLQVVLLMSTIGVLRRSITILGGARASAQATRAMTIRQTRSGFELFVLFNYGYFAHSLEKREIAKFAAAKRRLTIHPISSLSLAVKYGADVFPSNSTENCCQGLSF